MHKSIEIKCNKAIGWSNSNEMGILFLGNFVSWQNKNAKMLMVFRKNACCICGRHSSADEWRRYRASNVVCGHTTENQMSVK